MPAIETKPLKQDATEASAEEQVLRTIGTTRTFKAPIALVWRMWTEPEHLVEWWGPDGFSVTMHEMDVRTGGNWEFIMHGPDGRNYPNKSTYVEVVPHKSIVYRHEQPAFTSTVTFADHGQETVIEMNMLFDSRETRDIVAKTHGAVEGQQQTLNRLAAHLAGQ
jgi:uncharacterized protein YndB with AHSA1/START domain